METDKLASSYLDHLPAIFRQGPFLGRFLLAFERILTGPRPGGTDPVPLIPAGLEDVLDRIHAFFDPIGDSREGPTPPRAPDDFLPWLAEWVATSLRDDWDSDTKRAFISQIVPLYRMRGTRAGLEAVLKLYSSNVQVLEANDDASPAHFFRVILTVPERDPARLAQKATLVQAIIDREKPAHAFYGLEIRYPAMRINNDPKNNPAFGEGIILGKNTVLGTTTAKNV